MKKKSLSSNSTGTCPGCKGMPVLLVFAEAVPTEVVEVLDMTGFTWKAVFCAAAERMAPEEGWTGGWCSPRPRSRPRLLSRKCVAAKNP